MYAGEEKLKLGLDRLHKAADDTDLLGSALISLHGALEDRFRHALAATPELPAAEQKRVLDITKVQWNELIDMMRLYRGLSAEDAAQIQKMNRERQLVAHGDRYKAGRATLERYAQLVRSFFPGLELPKPAAESARPAPSPKTTTDLARPSRSQRPAVSSPNAAPPLATQTLDQSEGNPHPKRRAAPAEKSASQPARRTKQAATRPAQTDAVASQKRINPALMLILGLIFIVACLGLSTMIQNTTQPANTIPSNTQVIPSLPELRTPSYRITTDILNMRTAPGMVAPIITTLANGTRVELLNEQQELDGQSWVRVRAGDQDGWVDRRYLRDD